MELFRIRNKRRENNRPEDTGELIVNYQHRCPNDPNHIPIHNAVNIIGYTVHEARVVAENTQGTRPICDSCGNIFDIIDCHFTPY